MLNRSASLAMSTSILKVLPGKYDIKNTYLVFSIYSGENPPTEPGAELYCMESLFGI